MAKTTVHQLDKQGKCWREFHFHDRRPSEAQLLHSRIERAYKMASTMVTVEGHHAFGAIGTH